MDEEQIRARAFLEDALRQTGLTGTELARRAGLAPSTITRFMNSDGVSHTLSARSLSAVAKAAGLDYRQPVPTAALPQSAPLFARRLKAARWAYYGDELETATAQLKISATTLAEIEAGDREPDQALILRFTEVTGCPLDWLYLGRLTDPMPPEVAARIAVADPELVSAVLPLTAAAGRRKSGAL